MAASLNALALQVPGAPGTAVSVAGGLIAMPPPPAGLPQLVGQAPSQGQANALAALLASSPQDAQAQAQAQAQAHAQAVAQAQAHAQAVAQAQGLAVQPMQALTPEQAQALAQAQAQAQAQVMTAQVAQGQGLPQAAPVPEPEPEQAANARAVQGRGSEPKDVRADIMDARGGQDGGRKDPRQLAKEKMLAEKAKREEIEKMRCHLHKKPKEKGCKFCAKYKELLDEFNDPGKKAAAAGGSSNGPTTGRRKLDRAISEEAEREGGPLPLVNAKTYGFSPLLQTHVIECAHFKSLLSLETFEQLLDETYQFANSIEPYMTGSGTLPSAMFCCLYRAFTLGLDEAQVRKLIDSQDSPFLRCCGFLYIRFGLAHSELWNWLGEYVLDDEEFIPNPDNGAKTTIGEYVQSLLAEEKYFNTVLPRLPMSVKRLLEEKLAPVAQYRKRTQANKRIIDDFRERGQRVEACSQGEWVQGSVIDMDDENPSRLKVRVRFDDNTEDAVHIGKVILANSGRHSRHRGYSDDGVDWSRSKGRSDKELVDELRSKARESAVCSSGKDYARKPVGYKAACALPREQGAASYRLMEEETFVPMNRGAKRRSPTPEREMPFGKRPSAEHQANMQKLFEKYSTTESSKGSRGGKYDDVDKIDTMRLG
eukprot:gnl/TRDRNA2_/TRDRNA2_54485_c1_seq1.p1 gnl/TRDRNA2_/TRDRNA2_54485_c1~~gnl/TRDRNA2_/TRDRNA2_54485_c1_seq1.p1  ORF type:complete len:658 (+),score=143.33 gnl/TRDRNA2_/TRDRNA2_54485_c1_seq1:25-1974(+)